MRIKSLIRKAVKLFFLVVILWQTSRFCHHATEGFTLLSIQSNLSFHSDWESSTASTLSKETLDGILNQKFSYLNKGAQAYVFSSEDGCYVIKFFKHNHLRLSPLFSWFPLPRSLMHYRDEKAAQKKQLLEKDFESYKIAFEHLQEQTGLLYLHLNKTDYLKKNLILVDKLGIEHLLSLDSYEFVLQKKAQSVFEKIEMCMKKNEVDKAKNALSSLVNLVSCREKKGIFDTDPNFTKNFGFIEKEAIQIDVGRFSWEKCPLDKGRMSDDLKNWLFKKNYPELADHLEKTIQKSL